MGYLQQDADLFASWDVDFVKLDGCYSLPLDMDYGYPEFGRHLNRTGRPMIYSCSWPVYQIYAGINVSLRLCILVFYELNFFLLSQTSLRSLSIAICGVILMIFKTHGHH